VHVRPRCQLLRQGVQLPRRFDLALTNRCARAVSPRSTCTLVDFCADAICHHCLPGHLYSFTSLRISGQCIGVDVYIEDRYLRILRINNAAVDKINRNSISQGNQRISCYYRMTPTTATDRVAIEENQSSFILSLQKTRLVHYPVLTPVPCTTLETPPSAQPTTTMPWHHRLRPTRPLRSVRPSFLLQRRRYQGRSHALAGTRSLAASLSCFERNS
jgi:hypothetical protein